MTKWTRLSDLSTQVPLIYESNFFLILTFACILNILPCCLFAFCQRSRSFFRLPSVVFRKRVQRYNLFPNYQNFSHFFFKKIKLFFLTTPTLIIYIGRARGKTGEKAATGTFTRFRNGRQIMTVSWREKWFLSCF